MSWLKIEDQKPPNNHYVLVARLFIHKKSPIGNCYMIQIAARMNDAWIDDKDGELLSHKDGFVTHWMQLPDKPEVPK